MWRHIVIHSKNQLFNPVAVTNQIEQSTTVNVIGLWTAYARVIFCEFMPDLRSLFADTPAWVQCSQNYKVY